MSLGEGHYSIYFFQTKSLIGLFGLNQAPAVIFKYDLHNSFKVFIFIKTLQQQMRKKMSVYDEFINNISPQEWEYFAEDVLAYIGFIILEGPASGQDGGKDLIVQKDNDIFIVSCKHYSKDIGTSIENNIVDRIMEHNANGFIGFYSTYITESFKNRLQGISQQYKIITYNRMNIAQIIPDLSSTITQKYGRKPSGNSYVLNTDEDDYRPLNCLKCGKDILMPIFIRESMAMLHKDENDIYHYLYGCKECINSLSEEGWVEIYQALHSEQLISWNNMVDEDTKGKKVSNSFYRNKSEFDSKIAQRMFPRNMGTWI
ncbi:MAG: restriction endonuclease [Desulfobacterales bacterium]|nr:restriction endonuclease [Desulfobacterales bacterium]